MQMATGTKTIPRDLKKFRVGNGLTQVEVALRLGVTQPHYSRIEKGIVAPGNKLMRSVALLLKPHTVSEPPGKWLARVDRTARRSRQFRALVTAALALAEED